MEPLNIAVIGSGMYVCGRGTDGYGTVMPAISEWKRRNKPGVVYVAGTDPKGIAIAKSKIKELQHNTGVEFPVAYFPEADKRDRACYEEAIRRIPHPAACIIAVPDHLHGRIGAASIKNGLHTLIVKPLTPTVKEARELIALQRASGVYCAVEFHKRLDQSNLKLRDVIRGGSIGDPLYFSVEYSQKKSVPAERFRKWADKTNVFQYLGVHYVDIIYFTTAAKPVRAMGIGQKNWLVSRKIDTYDAVESLIEWRLPSGKIFGSSILTNWIDPERSFAMSDQRIKVIGTRGRLELDQKNRGITLVSDENGPEEINPYFCNSYYKGGKICYNGYGIESIRQFFDDVIDIENGLVKKENLNKDRPTFEQSVVSVGVVDAVNKSLASGGRWVNVGI